MEVLRSRLSFIILVFRQGMTKECPSDGILRTVTNG